MAQGFLVLSNGKSQVFVTSVRREVLDLIICSLGFKGWSGASVCLMNLHYWIIDTYCTRLTLPEKLQNRYVTPEIKTGVNSEVKVVTK